MEAGKSPASVDCIVCSSFFIVSSVCCVLLQKPGGTRKGRASGYIIFASEFRKEATQKNPDLSFGEISRFVGEKVLY